jgi:hypothetical protein
MLCYVDVRDISPFAGSWQRPLKRMLRKPLWRYRNIESMAEKQFRLTEFSDMVNAGLKTSQDSESGVPRRQTCLAAI